MIGTLARKRTQLRLPLALAAALIVALAGAMFAGSSAVRADTGDVTANSGFCVQTGTGDTAMYEVHTGTDSSSAKVTVENDSIEQANIPCPASGAGRPVRVEPNGTDRPTVTVLQPKLVVSVVGYPDGVIPIGTGDLTIRVRFENVIQFTHNAGAALVTSRLLPANVALAGTSTPYVDGHPSNDPRVIFEYVSVTSPTGAVTTPVLPAVTGMGFLGSSLAGSTYNVGGWLVPPGTPAGEYTLASSMQYDLYQNQTGGEARVNGQATLVLTDGATAVSSLDSVELTPFGALDNPLTTRDEAVAGSDTAAAGDSIWLQLNARDAEGRPAPGAQLSSVSVFGSGGTLAIHRAAAGAPAAAAAVAGTANTVTLADDVDSTLFVQVSKTNQQAGTVDVRAFIIGAGGTAESEPLTLTFTGSAASVNLGDDISLGRSSEAEIALSGTDAAGNTVPAGNVILRVTDADGNAVSPSLVQAQQETAGVSTPDIAGDDNANVEVVLVTVGDMAATGVYTITASLAGVADSADTVSVSVTGPAANLTLTADPTSSNTIAEQIMVTAMVSDADGNPVAEGTEVTFTLAGNALVVTGADANPAVAGHQARTAGGEATAQFTVVGAGTVVISALVGSQTEVVVIESTVGQASAETEDEPTGVDCLTNTVSFTTWICSTGTRASELFAELAAGGATAIHLNNGRSWVRYSVVNDRVVPGSRDFIIQEDDILYINN